MPATQTVVIVITSAISLILLDNFVRRLIRNHAADLALDAADARWRLRRKTRELILDDQYDRRVDSAIHHLTGTDWKDPTGKEAFARELYDGEVPGYLYYALMTDEIVLSEKEVRGIAEVFWEHRSPTIGDLELHRSPNREAGVVLRIRNSEKFVPTLIVKGKECPLYQIGNAGGIFGEHYKDPDYPCIQFPKLPRFSVKQAAT